MFGPNGAMETFQAARKAGKVRFIGFSAHSVETALCQLDTTISTPSSSPSILSSSRKPTSGRRWSRGREKKAWASWR